MPNPFKKLPLNGSFLKALSRSLALPALIGLAAGLVWLGLDFYSANNTKLENTWHGVVSYRDAVNKAAPSVVNIYTRKPAKNTNLTSNGSPQLNRYFRRGNLPQRMESTLGSGVIIRDDGYILTNNHVISDAQEIVVLLHDGREAMAQIVGTDPDSDLALLHIKLDNLKAIPTMDSHTLQVGDVVLAIGNPLGIGQTVTQGIVSALGRSGLNLNIYEDYIQTDAAINPGNSGGALTDAHGNLIGINAAILDKTGYSVGIGFAIPINDALKVMNDILTYGRVVRGWLGVEAQALSPKLAKSIGYASNEGLIITAIYQYGPAYKAGLKTGDIITHIDEQAIISGPRGMNYIANQSPGDTIAITVYRMGKVINTHATIGTRPTSG